MGFLKAIGPIGIFGETENRKEKELGGWGNAWHSSSVSQGVSFHSRVNRPRLLPMTTKHNAAMLMFMKKNKTIGISLEKEIVIASIHLTLPFAYFGNPQTYSYKTLCEVV